LGDLESAANPRNTGAIGETKLFHAPTPHPSPSSQASIQGPFVNTTPLTMRAPAALLLAGVFAALSHSASALVVNFTGDVVADFPIANSGVFVATDTTNDVFFTDSGTLRPTGWNAYDVRFAYDAGSDTAYFGKCSPWFSGLVLGLGSSWPMWLPASGSLVQPTYACCLVRVLAVKSMVS
jgi:hypothetical protein